MARHIIRTEQQGAVLCTDRPPATTYSDATTDAVLSSHRCRFYSIPMCVKRFVWVSYRLANYCPILDLLLRLMHATSDITSTAEATATTTATAVIVHQQG
jgi:hypothetical protein